VASELRPFHHRNDDLYCASLRLWGMKNDGPLLGSALFPALRRLLLETHFRSSKRTFGDVIGKKASRSS
jgi:hypothetical protein